MSITFLGVANSGQIVVGNLDGQTTIVTDYGRHDIPVGQSTTISKAGVQITANTRTAATLWRIRVNGVPQAAPLITVPALSTGFFGSTGAPLVIPAGASVSIEIKADVGGLPGEIIRGQYFAEGGTPNAEIQVSDFPANNLPMVAMGTTVLPAADIARVEEPSPIAGHLEGLYYRVESNTWTLAGSIQVLVGGAIVTVGSIPAGATGVNPGPIAIPSPVIGQPTWYAVIAAGARIVYRITPNPAESPAHLVRLTASVQLGSAVA